ncbi:MAG: mechanosensitive ion channel family protein [Bryobacteraceae bacterium]
MPLSAEKPAILIEQLMPFAIFAVALVVALIIRKISLKLLYRKLKDETSFRRVILEAVRVPSILWCLMAALEVALRYASLTESQVSLANKLIVAFLIISFSLVTSSVAVRMIVIRASKSEVGFAVSGLSRTLTRVFILSIGGLILLRHFNISITPALTALGVGGLAVALALQDTLANFFAGVHILVETPIRLGDFIKLSTGDEGVVSDIGWRTTRVKTGQNNTIVIPNTKITSGILTNYSLPSRRVAAEVTVLVALDADPEQVAAIVMEVAGSTEGALHDPSPVLLFDPGMTLTHMQFKLVVQVADQGSRGAVQSRIRLRLLERFRDHGVPLPSQKTVVVQP